MYNIIAPSFFQKKNCVLPGIGSLSLLTHPAESDFTNTQIKAPRQEIVFTSSSSGYGVFNEFSAISEMMKRNLDEEGRVELLGIGTFTKDSKGNIIFSAIQLDDNFNQPVTAERVIHKDAAHAILVGDKETTNVVMTEFYNEEPAITDRWRVWALLLAAIGIGTVVYYLSQYGANNFGSYF